MSIEIEDNCVGPCPMGCINCGRKHVAVHHCELCGDVIDEDCNHWNEDGEHEYCDDCYHKAIKYDESLTVDNMKDYGNRYAEAVEINGFLKYLYDKDEIEELLWKDFCAMPKEKQIDCLHEYVQEDEEDWVEKLGLEDNLE